MTERLPDNGEEPWAAILGARDEAGGFLRVAHNDDGTLKAHAASHESGGSDAIKLDELAAPTDVTTLNASTSQHGLLRKLTGAVTEFLNGTGGFSTPTVSETELDLTDITTGNASTSKHGLLPKLDGNAAHYLDGDGGWTTPAGSFGSGTDLRWFSVTAYGATGDGTTDDSAAIQDAIDAAQNATFAGIGGTVYFPTGKYYIATGLTCTLAGTSFVGEGQPGTSSDLASGDTQIIVGNGIWGLTLGTTTTEYRGYQMKNLQFYEKNAGQAYGGVKLNASNYGTYENCSFGTFTKSVTTTFNGTPGALSTLSTLTLASTTGWPTAGSGYIKTTAGSGGSDYHAFWYTGVSGSTLTGVVYSVPTTDTVAASAEVVAAVGVGFLVNIGNATSEASNNRFLHCNFGTCKFGMLQLGVSLSWITSSMFDGQHNIVTSYTANTIGLMAVNGAILASNCEAQAYDTCIQVCKANNESHLQFRLEGWHTAGIVLYGENASSPTPTVVDATGGSNQTDHGPGIIVNTNVQNCNIRAAPTCATPVQDYGTGTRYPLVQGASVGGPSVVGTIVGRSAVYDPTSGLLIGYAPLYDAITGIYFVQTLLTPTQMNGPSTGVGSVSHTISSAVAVGDFLVIGGGYGLGSTVTITPSDTGGNSWAVDRHDDKTTSGSPHSFVASCKVTTALAVGATITVTFSSNVNYPVCAVSQYKGMATSSWVDAVVGATGTSTTPASGNLTTAADSELLYASVYYVAPSPDTGVAGSSYTIRDGPYNVATIKEMFTETKTSGVAGTFSAGATLGSSVDWAISLVAYKRA